jgi:RNA polymerase sigma-70 factor (ECF subfamily)
VLILRDVLGFSAREVAGALQTTPTGVDSALQRAHRAVEERMPERSQQATLRSLGDERLGALVAEFVEAWERGDTGALVAMLAEGAILTMPPRPAWFRGREAVGTFLAGWPLHRGGRWRVVPTHANGQLAFAYYLDDEGRGTFAAYGITVVTLDGAEIAEMTAFLDAELIPRFGLPDRFEP